MKWILFYWVTQSLSSGVTEYVDPNDYVTELQCRQAIAKMDFEHIEWKGQGLYAYPNPKKIAFTWTCEEARRK